MKKKTTITLLLVFVAGTALFAQAFSLELTGGYNLSVAPYYRSTTANQFQTLNNSNIYATSSASVTSTSFGQGGNIALNFNWFSKNNIGCGIKLNALISSPFSTPVYVSYANGSTADFTYTDKGFSFQFIPHMCFRHDFKVVTPVLEIGMIVGINNINESFQADLSSGDMIQSASNQHGGVMLGFYSSLGLAIKLSKVVKLIVAVNGTAASYSPTEWTMKSFYYDNVSQINNLPISQTQGVYVKQLDMTAAQSTGQPGQSLKFSVPFSNVGFNVGFAFQFGRQRTAAIGKDGNNKDGTLHPF